MMTATVRPVPSGSGFVTGDLQALITAAPTGSVLDLRRYTAFTSGATVSKSLALIGGTITVGTAATALNVTASDVTIDGVTINGPQCADLHDDQIGIKVYGTHASRLDTITIRNCRVRNFGMYGIAVSYVDDIFIDDNHVSDVKYAAIQTLNIRLGEIRRNLVERIAMNGSPGDNAYGISVNDSYDATEPSRDITIADNTCIDMPTWEGIGCHGGLRLAFLRNIMRRVKFPMRLNLSPNTGNAVDLILDGNVYRLSIVDPAVTVPLTFEQVHGAYLANNVFAGWAGYSPSVGTPYYDFSGGNPTLVRQTVDTTAAGSGATRSVTIPATDADSSLIVITGGTVIDGVTAGGVTGLLIGGSAAGSVTYQYVLPNVPAGTTSVVITPHTNGAVLANVSEWANLPQSDPRDQVATATAGSGDPGAGPVTPTAKINLCIASAADGPSFTGGPSAGWTALTAPSGSGNFRLVAAYKVQAAATAASCSWTSSAVGFTWDSVIADLAGLCSLNVVVGTGNVVAP